MIWPYYVSEGSSEGDLLIAFVFVQFFVFFSPFLYTLVDPREVTAPRGSPTRVLTAYQRENGEWGRGGEHSEDSHTTLPVQRLDWECWTRANASTKTSVTSPSFMGEYNNIL